MTDTDVLVVGAGIIGASVASSLARRGVQVTVLDAGAPLGGSSSANAGHLVPSHVIPFAAPGMVRAGLRSLARRDGAFAINPRLRPQLAPWLTRFAAAASQENVRRGAPVLDALLRSTMAQVQRLADAGWDLDLGLDGLIQVFTNPDSLEGARHEVEQLRALGHQAQELTRDALAQAEPIVRGAVGAVLLPEDGRLDPALLLTALTQEAIANGARFLTERVLSIAASSSGCIVTTPTRGHRVDQVVVAAGVWTPALVVGSGVRLPILPAKGYGITVPGVEPLPHRPLLLMDQRLAVTPMHRGLRITGRFELTRPGDRGIPPRRVRALLDRARPVLGLPASSALADPWTGLRPATPDGLPVIGRLADRPSVVVACGHGMLGTTMGPGTGEVVAALLAGEAPAIDLGPLSPDRFSGRLPRRVR